MTVRHEHKSKTLFLARRWVIVMFCAVLRRGRGAPSAGLEERGMVALETPVSDRGKESNGKTDGTDETTASVYRTAQRCTEESAMNEQMAVDVYIRR